MENIKEGMLKLNQIQNELKAAKDKKNSFGGYNYRNIEVIYTELKPILAKYKAHLKMTSDLVQVGDNTYIKVIGTFVDLEGDYEETATSFAAIDFNHKGMSAEQATGAAQTYAAKYVINHLFLLDDGSEDPDSKEPKNYEESNQQPKKPYTTQPINENRQYGVDFKEADNIHNVDELYDWYNKVLPLLKTEKQKTTLTNICTKRKQIILKGKEYAE